MTDQVSRRTALKLAGTGALALAVGKSMVQMPTAALAAPAAQMMGLDPQASAVIEQLMALEVPPLNTLTPFQARQISPVMDAVFAVLTAQNKPPLEPVADIKHILIPGPAGSLLARVYTPAGSGPFPGLVYFHGGGWVFGNLETYDSSCRALCNAAGSVVVSVAYRQAPEAPFPAAAEDAYAALQWVIANAASIGIDGTRVAVAGESAGGNLATVASLIARDRGGVLPIHQLLVYPVTNYAFDTPSYAEFVAAAPLNTALMQWFWSYYLPSEADGANPYASPLRADVSGLPPATVITAEVDPLRDEGEAYANHLRDAGIAVMSVRYTGVMHEFFGMPAILDTAKQAVADAARELKAAFGTA